MIDAATQLDAERCFQLELWRAVDGRLGIAAKQAEMVAAIDQAMRDHHAACDQHGWSLKRGEQILALFNDRCEAALDLFVSTQKRYGIGAAASIWIEMKTNMAQLYGAPRT